MQCRYSFALVVGGSQQETEIQKTLLLKGGL